MSRIISEREALMDMLTDMIGDLVAGSSSTPSGR